MDKPFFIIRKEDIKKFEKLYSPTLKKLCWDHQYFEASNIQLQQQFLFYNHAQQLLLLCQINDDTIVDKDNYKLLCANIISHYRVQKNIFFYTFHQYTGTKFFDIHRKSHHRRVAILKNFFLDPKIQVFLTSIKLEKHYEW